VLFVTSILEDDSPGRHVLRLARELRRRGKDVGLLCGGGPLLNDFEGIGISPIAVRALRKARRLRVLPQATLERVARWKADLLHLFGEELQRLGPSLAAATGKAYVLTVGGLDARQRVRIRGNWGCGSVLTTSEKLREQLVNRGRLPKDVIGVLPIGIALADYERYCGEGFAGRVPVVGMVGPLTEDSGVGQFVLAARKVRDSEREVRFLIAGAGPESKRVRRLVKEQELEPWATIVEDFTDYRRMLGVLDIRVVPSAGEGVGLHVIEAMACRKAVIAAGGDAVYGIVRDGETGFVVPAGSPDAIAERIIELVDSPERARALVDAAYDVVRERHSLQASVNTLLSFYGKCLQRTEKA
jgi:glycosyltransferase involved in cell wall biosynthesis